MYNNNVLAPLLQQIYIINTRIESKNEPYEPYEPLTKHSLKGSIWIRNPLLLHQYLKYNSSNNLFVLISNHGSAGRWAVLIVALEIKTPHMKTM